MGYAMPSLAPQSFPGAHVPHGAVEPAPRLSHLKKLEAESIYILREAAAEFARPVMLYSIGKDSSVMLRLAQKAFFPGKIPFPLLHIDTSYKFPEMIAFRDSYTREIGAELIVHQNREALDAGRESLRARHAEVLRPAQDQVAAGCAGRGRIRRGVWRRAPRRGEIARQGAHLFVPRSARPVGPEESAAGAVEHLQFAHQQGRKHSRLSALELDRAGRLAVHPHGKHSDRAAVFRARSARWCCAAARSSLIHSHKRSAARRASRRW